MHASYVIFRKAAVCLSCVHCEPKEEQRQRNEGRNGTDMSMLFSLSSLLIDQYCSLFDTLLFVKGLIYIA